METITRLRLFDQGDNRSKVQRRCRGNTNRSGRRLIQMAQTPDLTLTPSQVRNIGKVEGNSPASDNDWEEVTKDGDDAIQKWVDDQLKGRGCTVVLIGNKTAGRKWIDYEIEKSWNDKKGILGVHIHNLKNSEGNQGTKGANPFSNFTKSWVGESKVANP